MFEQASATPDLGPNMSSASELLVPLACYSSITLTAGTSDFLEGP